MRRCVNCFMPETKPGLILDIDGVCQACRNYEKRKDIDWSERFLQLESLLNEFRQDDYYDCIIPVSGGKDSYFQVYTIKHQLDMNPLLVKFVDPFTKTEVGEKNLKNLTERFGCDLIELHLNPKIVRRMVRIAFEEFGNPTWPIDRAIYCWPHRLAGQMKIPLVIWGENVSYEYGGVLSANTPSARDQINNTIARNIRTAWWNERGFTDRDLNQLCYPTRANIEPVYLSYYVPWDGFENYKLAQEWGFTNLEGEWNRDGYIENYDAIDSVGYLINAWMKYPKFGFARITDVVGYWIRSSKIDAKKGLKLIAENDHKLDRHILEDFLKFTGYTEKKFWSIVEKFWNRDIFEKVGGKWKLKK